MSVADELDKLKKLHDDGTITDEQYERAKAKLLDESREPAPEDKRRPRRRDPGSPDEFEDEASALQRKEKKVREWATILHLSLFAGHLVPGGGIVAPLVIWQTQKDEMPELDEHGKNAMNWVITFVIGLFVFGLLSFFLIGLPFLFALLALNVVFPIIAAVKANEGKVWKYPLTITFIK